MSSFKIVFADGTFGEFEGAIVRFTPDDSANPVEDFPIQYLMQNLANIDDAKDAMTESLKYPADSTDPNYISALYDLNNAMAALFGNVMLPPVLQPEPLDIETTAQTTTPSEPEFWN